MRTGLGPIYGSETTTKAVQSRIRIDSALSSRLGIGNACICQGARGVALDMSRIHPESPASDPSDRSVAADVLARATNRPESPDLGNILRRFLNVYAIYHCKGCVPQSGKPTVP